MTDIDLGDMLRRYESDPDRDDWPVVPLAAIGADGQPVTCWWPIKSLGPVPDGHVLAFNDSGGWEFRPIRVN
jgi:hypothetical protein